MPFYFHGGEAECFKKRGFIGAGRIFTVETLRKECLKKISDKLLFFFLLFFVLFSFLMFFF